MASVRHATSVQGADDPGKSVQAAQWNEDHTLVNVADQTSLDNVSAAVSVVAANLSSLSVTVAAIAGGEVHPTSAEFVSLAADHSVLSIQVTNVSAAVSVVAANLSNEISLRSSQINTASGAVSTLSLALSAEAAARIAGDNAASGAVSTLSLAVSVVAAALSNEISLRAAQINTASGAVSTLSLAVSVVAAQLSTTSIQVTNVSAAVSVVAVNLSNEISLRNSQINTASGAVSTLSLALSVETAARIAADNTASGAVSTLSLAVSVVAAGLSALSSQVSTLSVQVSTLSAQMTSLVASKIVMLGAQTISVSALTNVSGQAFSVGANNTYAFKYMVIYQAASTATGLGLSVTFPGMKTFAATAYITSGATGTANTFSGPITASGTKIQALSCQTAATDFYAVVEGTFQVSTSGTLQLQADSGVGGTSAQVIIRPGTFGMVWRGA